MSGETFYDVRSDVLQCQGKFFAMPGEMSTMSGEMSYNVRENVLQCQGKCFTSVEMFYNVSRDVLQCQERCLTMSGEMFYNVRRDVLQCQGKCFTMSVEMFYNVRRDVLQCQGKCFTMSGEIIIIIIIAFKGAIRDFLQSPHSVANCLQHVCSNGPGTTVCKSHATHRALITCKCHVTCHLVQRDSSAIMFYLSFILLAEPLN